MSGQTLPAGKLLSGVPVPAYSATQPWAMVGVRGSGKSYAAMKLAEVLLEEGTQVIAIDPVGVWYGLRLASGGKKRGIAIPVLGGIHGDMPLEHTSGGVVANWLADNGSSAVLDVSAMRKGQMQLFVAEFAEELYRRQKEIRRPLHLALEEAQLFAPQRTMPATARMLGAIEDIVRLGRNCGIGCSMVTQRPQSVNKEVLNQAEPLCVFRLVGPHERKAVAEWVRHAGADAAAMLELLPKLPTGECYFWSPSWAGVLERTRFRPRKTFDASATPSGLATDDDGPPKLRPIDLAQLSASMQETIAAAEANDPAKLRKRVAALEKELAAAGPSETAIAKAEKRGAAERDKFWKPKLRYMDRKVREWRDRMMGMQPHLRSMAKLVKFEYSEPPDGLVTMVEETTPTRESFASREYSRLRSPPPAAPRDDANGSLGKAPRAILRALYWLRGEPFDRSRVALYADYSAGSSTFRNAMSALRVEGLLQGNAITDAGIDYAEGQLAAGDRPEGSELREWLRPKLGRAANQLLDVLLEDAGTLEYSALGEASGYSAGSSTFRNAISRLRVAGAVTGGKNDGVRASRVFFEG